MFGIRIPPEVLFILGVIIVVVVFAVWSSMLRRDQQHDEVVSAIKGKTQDKTPHSRTAEERLAEIDSLRESGALSDEEYEAKRKEILELHLTSPARWFPHLPVMSRLEQFPRSPGQCFSELLPVGLRLPPLGVT